MVRHPLVARIVDAYDAARKPMQAAERGGRRRPLSSSLSLQFADRDATARCCRGTAWRAGSRARSTRPAQITVRIVGADEGRALNRAYRGKDYATNVLTFDYAREPVVQADLVLCAPVVRARGARRRASRCEAHYAHLLVHGTLHAQGYDHEASADARRDGSARDVRCCAAWVSPTRTARDGSPGGRSGSAALRLGLAIGDGLRHPSAGCRLPDAGCRCSLPAARCRMLPAARCPRPLRAPRSARLRPAGRDRASAT